MSKHKFFKLKNIKAYSLLEMSITITIVALIVSGGLGIYGKRLDSSRYQVTTDKLRIIESAIQTFAKNIESASFGFLPCPADPSLNITDNNFGVASNYNPSTGRCAITVGSVPIKDLNLPIDYAFDSWNRRFTYHISDNLGNRIDFLNNENRGNLSIIDINGNEKTEINKPAPNNRGGAYVVVSHGPNGLGAYIYDGSARLPESNGTEAQNSNQDNIYLQTDLKADYDDLVVYKTKAQLVRPMINPSPVLVNNVSCSGASIVYSAGDPISTTNSLQTFRNMQVQYQSLADTIYQSAEALIQICSSQTEISFEDCENTPQYDRLENNLVLWLDATDPNNTGSESAHNSTVAVWVDKSGNSNDFAPFGTIIYTAEAMQKNPALLFTGTQYMQANNADIIPSGNASYSIFISFQPSNLIATHNIFGIDSTGNRDNLIQVNNLGNMINSWNNPSLMATSTDTVSTSQNYVFSAVYSSFDNNLSIFLNGNPNGTLANNYNGAALEFARIAGGTGTNFQGYIGEILVYDKAVSSYEREIIENYLISKWVTSGSCN